MIASNRRYWLLWKLLNDIFLRGFNFIVCERCFFENISQDEKITVLELPQDLVLDKIYFLLQEEIEEFMDVQSPDTTSYEERRKQRTEQENSKFDVEHYV